MSAPAPGLPGALRRFAASPCGVLTLVLTATTLVYLPSFDGAWQLDDRPAILDNAGLESFEADAILRFGWTRALSQLSFAANKALSGAAIGSYHLINLLIHGVNAALLFALGRSIGASRGRGGLAAPAFAALIFALHPLQTQGVVNIVQRSELLCAGLTLAALLLQLRDRAALAEKPTFAGYGALLCALLAMTAKEPGFMAPLLILLIELWLVPSGPHAAVSRRRMVWRLAPWLLLLMLSLGAFLIARGGLVFSPTNRGIGPWAYFMSQQEALARLAGLALWPGGQSIDHAVTTQTAAEAWPWFLGLAAGAAFIVIKRREAPLLFWALASSVLYLAPSSSFAPLEDALVEHRAYLPLGLFVLALIIEGERRCPTRYRRRAVMGLVALVIALAIANQARQRMWSSPLALWEEATRRGGADDRPWVRLGLIVSAENIWQVVQEGEDRIYARKVPGGYAPCPELCGGALIKDPKAATPPRALALDCYRRAIAADPGSREGRVNLGAGLASLGLELGPTDPEEARPLLIEAEGLLRGVCEDEPDSIAARFNLGLILASDPERRSEALTLLTEAEALASRRGQVVPGLSRALGKLRQGQSRAEDGRE